MNHKDTSEIELDEGVLELLNDPGLKSNLRGVPLGESRRGKYVPRSRPEPGIRPGVQIGMLTLIEKNSIKGVYQPYANREWKCRCDCGREIIETYHRIYYGQVYSCGCTPKPRNKVHHNHAGEEHGRLTVIEWLTGKGWLCVCECGQEEFVRFSNLLTRTGAEKCPHSTH